LAYFYTVSSSADGAALARDFTKKKAGKSIAFLATGW
jgi:hypothetical protein